MATGHHTPAFAATRLVSGLTRRDLSRNIGTWRIPLASSALFAFLFVNSAFITSAGQDQAAGLTYSVAVDGDLPGGGQFLTELDRQRFEVEPAQGGSAAEDVQDAEVTVGLTLPADLDERIAAGQPITMPVHQRTRDNVSQEATGWLLVFMSERYGIAGTVPGGIVIDEHDIADDADANRDQFARMFAALAAFLALGTVTSVASILGGTRDRRGAEALLVLPVPRTAIAGGTAAGAWPLNAAQVVVGLLALLSVALLPFPTLSQPLGTLVPALPPTVLAAALLAAFGGGLGVVAGALGGGSSDTMSVGDLLAMPLAALGIALLVSPELPSDTPAMVVPGLGPLLLLRDAVLGRATIGDAALATVGTGIGAALLVLAAGRLLRSERNVRRT